MKKIISIVTIVAIMFTQLIALPAIQGADQNVQKAIAAPIPMTNILYDYFNGLSTLERRAFLETNLALMIQYGGTNAYDTYADLLVNNLNASGALTKMGVTKPQLEATFTTLATVAGQNHFRAAFETAVTTQLDDTTMLSATNYLVMNAVITASMETFVNQFLVKFYGALSTLDSHVYLDTSGTITIENSAAFIASVRLMFENQADMALLDVPALLASYIAVIQAQTPTLKAALITDLKGMKLMVNIPVVPKLDIYAKYNLLTTAQKQEVTDAIHYALMQPTVLSGAQWYYDLVAGWLPAGQENLPNGFGITPANYLLFIQKIQNPANAAAVNALFQPFTTLSESAVFARLDAAETAGIMNAQMKTLMKKFFPWLNIYSKLKMPILDDTNPLQANVNSTLPVLDQFFALLMLSDYPESSEFKEINDEVIAWFVNFYNALPVSGDKKTMRDYMIYFDIMKGDNIPPVPAFYPTNGSTNVSISTAIKITFNEPVTMAAGITNFTQCFKITTDGKNVHFTVTQSADGKTFIFTPDRIYCDATYTVSIIPNTIVDLSGNTTSGSATWKTPKQLISLDIVNPVTKNTIYFLPGGTNTISFKGLANDKATYKLMYKVKGVWKTVSIRNTSIAGDFSWDWNGKYAGKYLPASSKPYDFKIIKIYNGKTTTVKSFKVVIQAQPKVVVVIPKVYEPAKKKTMGIKVSYNKYSDVKVVVYDHNWKVVKVLYNKKHQKPNTKLVVRWDGKDAKGKYVKAGYYYIKTTVGSKVIIKRVLITDFDNGHNK
ncbi:MAG: Ig-like domain-containing protein [Clostridia bacterium]